MEVGGHNEERSSLLTICNLYVSRTLFPYHKHLIKLMSFHICLPYDAPQYKSIEARLPVLRIQDAFVLFLLKVKTLL